MESNRISVMVCTRDRPTEIYSLLISLRTQTYKNFDIFILEDCSGTPLQNYHFLNCIINKLNEEGNHVYFQRTPFNYGVSKSRQTLVDWALLENDNELFCRLDDDVIIEKDYFEKLIGVINKGYDLSTGVTPFIGQPQFKRESKFIQPVGNKVILDKEGNFLFNGDDCGMEYLDEAILPIHHFRSCALYKRELHNSVDYKSNFTKHGFREEEIFSFKAILAGFKLGMSTKAIAWHLLTPSGGERFAESNDMIKINEQVLRDFVKEKYKEFGDFIESYNKKYGIKVPELTYEDSIKQTNLIIR